MAMEDDLIEYVRFDNDQDFLNDAPDKESRSSTWTKSQTLKLIDAYSQYKESFTHVRQRKHAWELISTHLQALDVMKSAKDCSLKWSNLTRTYKTVKDNRNKTGRGPIRFEFFKEIDDIIGQKNSNAEQGVGVNVGASTSQVNVLANIEGVEVNETQLAPKQKKRRLTYKDQYYKAKMERLAKKEEREEEILKIEKEKLEVLKQLLNK